MPGLDQPSRCASNQLRGPTRRNRLNLSAVAARPILSSPQAAIAPVHLPMLYNSRRSLISNPIRDYSRPQTARHRLLHPGMGNHGRRRLAGHHGRLAAARWLSGNCPRILNRRRAAAADRLGLRQTGHCDARCRGRGRLHLSGLPAVNEFRHRMDDDSRLFHRLSMGGCRGRTHRRHTFSPASIRWKFIASPAVRFIFRT